MTTVDEIKKTEFTTKQIVESVGIKPNTLHYYIENGAIVPDIDQSQGRGTQRRFSAVNMIEIVIIHRLIKIGLLKKNITQMIKGLRDKGDREKLIMSPYPHDDELDLVFTVDDNDVCKHYFVFSSGDENLIGLSLRDVIRKNVSVVFDVRHLCLQYVVSQL